MLDRWGWQPPEREVAEKERRAGELHQAAIDARVSFEASTRTTRPLIQRLERLAAAYVAEEKSSADHAATRASRRR
jgi:hypothetical protein